MSNAESDGLTEDLHFPPNGYGIMLSVFYVPFCTLVVPGVMLTRAIGPKWTIPGYMIGWGAMAMVGAGALNFGGQLATRVGKNNLHNLVRLSADVCSPGRFRSRLRGKLNILPHDVLY